MIYHVTTACRKPVQYERNPYPVLDSPDKTELICRSKVIKIELLLILIRCILIYGQKENQETIRQRDTCRSHQRDGEAASGNVGTKKLPSVHTRS
jgi:hypothetical protein